MLAKSPIRRPLTLRRISAVVAAGLASTTLANGAAAQDAGDEAEDLGVVEYSDRAADVNPHTQPGNPYRAETSADPRRTRPLSETPQTIQVITETQIEEQGASDLRDLVDNVPGVTIGTGENGNAFGDRYIIRGHEARSDVFVDGLRDPGMTTRETFAVDQIEITKGPSSSFAGRGAIGGAVNSITKQASTDYMFARVDAGIGTDDFYRATVDLNLPLSATIAVRANLLASYDEVPNRNFSTRERLGAALSASFALSEALSFTLDYYHLSADDLPDIGSYTPAPTGTGPGDVTFHQPWDEIPNYAQEGDFLDTDVDTFTARLKLELGDSFALHNSTRYGETRNGYLVTGLRGGAWQPATSNWAPLTLSTHQGNQEVSYFVNQLNLIGQFEAGGMAHSLIAGAEYSDQRVANGTYAITNGNAFTCRTGTATSNNAFCLTDASRNVVFDAVNIHKVINRSYSFGIVDSDWNVETFGVYLMDTVDVTPWLSLHGGLRMDAFDYRNSVVAGGVTTDYSFSDTLWHGHAGIGVKPLEEVYLYLNYGTGSEINGGESDLGGNCGYGGVCVATGTSVDDGKPESVETFELGLKADLFDDRFLVTAAAFRITKSDIFETAGDGYTAGGSLNTGRTRVDGVELGVVGNITDSLLLQAALTLMDSEVLATSRTLPATAPAGSTWLGKEIANFADTQFSAQGRWQATDQLALGGTATYRSAMHVGQPDSAADYNFTLDVYNFTIPAYWTFDAFASYQLTPAIGARVNVTNLGDNDYYVAGYRSGHFLYKGDERRAVLTLTARL